MNFFLEIIAWMLLIVSRTLFSKTDMALPKPDLNFHAVNTPKVLGWPKNKIPTAPPFFVVAKLADNLNNPRMIYETPDLQLLVAESTANRVSQLIDENQDGFYEKKIAVLKKIRKPFGMLVLNNFLYVAGENSLMKYPYQKEISKLDENAGKKILDLPSEGNHWTRNIIADKKGTKLYISVGSASNIAENGIEKEKNRAAILVCDTDGKNVKVFASGMRNPVGLGWAPGTNDLWTTVAERDFLGEDLVPDYFTHVRPNGFYGWPYSYFGANIDPRVARPKPELIKAALVPDIKLQAHATALGLGFYEKRAFPSHYHDGAFIAEHGSWNRKELSGYKVIFIPFKNGRPAGPPEDFLTGFISDTKNDEVFGRPVGITITDNGALLVTDDGANVIWSITYKK
jgi:glucose/arabinose dehydrogenase